jgi:RNA polymerase-binding transcription factor DksA
MTENRTIHLIDIPIGGKGGFVWNQLHAEREDICDALIKRAGSTAQAHQRQELLQTRLRTIDDALDRLMSGSYGICSKCGGVIEETILDRDPAGALCRDCLGRESVALQNHLTLCQESEVLIGMPSH